MTVESVPASEGADLLLYHYGIENAGTMTDRIGFVSLSLICHIQKVQKWYLGTVSSLVIPVIQAV